MKTPSLFVVGLLAGATLAAASYRDVPRKHWAFQEVQWVRDTGLVPDSQGDRYEGTKGMTRYQMAQVMAGYMRDYYSKRDVIQAELTDLKNVGAAHEQEMQQLSARQQVVVEQLEAGAQPLPEAAPASPAPVAAAPEPAPTPTESASSASGGSALADRLEAMRRRIRESRGGGDPRAERERLGGL